MKALRRAFNFRWMMNRISGYKADVLICKYKIYIRSLLEFASPLLLRLNSFAKSKLERVQQVFVCWALGTAYWTARYQVDLLSRVLPLKRRLEARALITHSKRNFSNTPYLDERIRIVCLNEKITEPKMKSRRTILTTFRNNFIDEKRLRQDKCTEESLTRGVILATDTRKRMKNNLSRQKEVLLNQMILDTAPFIQKKVRGKRKKHNLCNENCNNAKKTIGHYLFDCPLLNTIRKKFLCDEENLTMKRKIAVISDPKRLDGIHQG